MDIASLGIKIQTQGAKEAAADLDRLQTSATRTEATVKKIAPASRTSAEALALFSKIDPAAGKLQKLDDLEASLTKLSKAGKVGAADFAAMSAKIAEHRGRIIGEGMAVKEAASLVEKFTSNTRMMSEASTIASDVVSGQFGRIRRSAAAMANASGVFRLAFTGTGAIVLGVAAAVGTLGLAAEKASNETEDFNNAIILTGNYAGVTTDKLRKMAEEIGRSTGATTGNASKVLAEVAASGQFTAEQMHLVTKAALEMEQATGRSIKETVKDFTSLKGDPVEALLKLNEVSDDGKGITHFLTQEVIEQVKALQDQGREADATALALKALYDGINQRAPAAAQNMSLIGSVLHGIAEEAKHDLDAVVGFFRGADEGIRNFILSHEKALRSMANLSAALPGNIFGNAQLDIFNSVLSSAKNANRPNFSNVTSGTPVDSTTERDYLRFRDEYLTKANKKQDALNKLDQLALQLHLKDTEVAKIRAGIEEHFKDPKGRKSSGVALEGAENRAALAQYEDELKREQGAITNQTQLLEANYAARNISAEKYYDEQRRLAKAANDAQIHALEGEISVLQSRNVKGKQSVDNARELAEKEAELAKARADGATKAQVLDIQEAALLKQRQQANQAYKDALDQNTNALKADFDSQVLRIGMGEREFEMQSRINELYRDEAKELLNLARARDASEIDAATYATRVEQLKASTEQEVQIVRDGYARMSEAQANWQNGAVKAFDDYRDAANDVAGQVSGIFTDAFHGLEDVLVDFFTKGKADWKGFLDSIAAEITRFIVRQQLTKWLGGLFNQQGGGGGGTESAIGGIFGAIFGGGGEQWYANGGAFLGGQPVQMFANGGILDRPTMFRTGKGWAVGGEVADEAILPLHRGADGKLGVRMEASNDSRAAGPTVVNQTVVVQGRIDSRTPDQFAQSTARAQNRASARNR